MSTKQVKVKKNNVQSRQQYKRNKKNQQTNVKTTSAHSRRQRRLEKKAAKKQNKTPMRRIFPIWLRLIVVAALCVLALIVGLMIGYGILGDGTPSDVLQKETWKHIIDLIKKD